MKKSKQVVGELIVSAPVNRTLDEAAITDSAHGRMGHAFAQLGQALHAFGPFQLGRDMCFVEAGIKLDVLDASQGQNADFDEAAFEAFVRHAHDVCSDALHAPGEPAAQLGGAAETFAVDEGRDVKTIKALFNSLATQPGVSLISGEGELIELGVGSQTGDDNVNDTDMEIEVGRIRRITRIKTANGSYDVPSELAEDLQVGDHICVDGVEPPTGAACVRAESIDAGDDPSGELFDDSACA